MSTHLEAITTLQSVRVVLRRERHQRGLTQLQLANEVGTTEVSVSRWERGTIVPGPYFREKLATLFGKSAEELGFISRADKTPRREGVYDPHIPSPVLDLVGRENLLSHLKTRLEDVVALSGLPGVGKTAVAAHLAHDVAVRARFADGVLWAELGPHPDLLNVLSRWGRLLGIQEPLTSLDEWSVALRESIGLRHLFVVLDNAWHHEDALLLRIGGPHCAYLVTTRSPALASLFDRDRIHMEELSVETGQALLERLAPHFVAHHPHAARRLVQLAGGLPLSVVLMGTSLRMQQGNNRRVNATVRMLQERAERSTLAQPQALFPTYPGTLGRPSLSLHAIIGPSIDGLSPEAQRTLRALAHFPPKPNSFSEQAALAVATCSGVELDHLTDAGVLEMQGTRYSLHPTIADHCLLTQQSDDTDVLRFVSYFLWFVQEYVREESALTQEYANILAAVHLALEQHLFSCVMALLATFFSSPVGRDLSVQETERRLLALERTVTFHLEHQE